MGKKLTILSRVKSFRNNKGIYNWYRKDLNLPKFLEKDSTEEIKWEQKMAAKVLSTETDNTYQLIIIFKAHFKMYLYSQL